MAPALVPNSLLLKKLVIDYKEHEHLTKRAFRNK